MIVALPGRFSYLFYYGKNENIFYLLSFQKLMTRIKPFGKMKIFYFFF